MGGGLQDDHEGRRDLWSVCTIPTHGFVGREKVFPPVLTFSITVLEGANPSAEGEDAEEGLDAGGADTRVLDIEDQFRLNKIEAKPSKKAFQGEIKSTTKATGL
jgi:hypothetical protein